MSIIRRRTPILRQNCVFWCGQTTYKSVTKFLLCLEGTYANAETRNKINIKRCFGRVVWTHATYEYLLCLEWCQSSWPDRCAPSCWGVNTCWGVLHPGCFSQHSANFFCHCAASWNHQAKEPLTSNTWSLDKVCHLLDGKLKFTSIKAKQFSFSNM